MNKAVWITLLVAVIAVNGIAELVYYFTDFNIVMFFRIALILGITAIASVFVGSLMLVGKLEQERPLSGTVKDTLGADKKKEVP